MYTAAYMYEQQGTGYGICEKMPPCAMDVAELLDRLNGMGERISFLGDGVPVYQELIQKCCSVPYVIAPAGLNRQRAAGIAALGSIYFAGGRTVPAGEHRPEYLRKSQAEREKALWESKSENCRMAT